MKLFASLYAMVWLVLLEFLTLMLSRGELATWTHMGLGALIVAFAYLNARALAGTAAPARTKRVAKAIFAISGAGAVLGALLYFNIAPGLGFLSGGPVYVLHLLAAFAIITQAASVATSYDMWEEKEFEAPLPTGDQPVRAEPPSTALY